jgi:hypothetical protein
VAVVVVVVVLLVMIAVVVEKREKKAKTTTIPMTTRKTMLRLQETRMKAGRGMGVAIMVLAAMAAMTKTI